MIIASLPELKGFLFVHFYRDVKAGNILLGEDGSVQIAGNNNQYFNVYGKTEMLHENQLRFNVAGCMFQLSQVHVDTFRL